MWGNTTLFHLAKSIEKILRKDNYWHFFFDTRQAIEKTTNLHYNLCICFILDYIHFFIGILFFRERNEWICGITFVN